MARYYTIQISGYGGESVYGKITKEQYDFWSNEEAVEEVFEDFSSAFNEYFWDMEEWNDKVPAEAQFDCEWHDIDDIEHSNGCTLNTGMLEI